MALALPIGIDHQTAERAASLGLPARLVIWADHAPAALARWARRHDIVGECVEQFLLSARLVAALRRGGLSVTTGTVNDPALLARCCASGPMRSPLMHRTRCAGVSSRAA